MKPKTFDRVTSKDKYKVFNKISLSSKDMYIPLDKHYKKIYIMQQPSIYEKENIMLLHALNFQDKILDKMENNLNLYDEIRDKKTKHAPIKDKKVVSKCINLQLNSRKALLTNFNELDPRMVKKYAELHKKGKTGESSPIENKKSKLCSLSNSQILELILNGKENEKKKSNKMFKFENVISNPLEYERIRSFNYCRDIKKKNISPSKNINNNITPSNPRIISRINSPLPNNNYVDHFDNFNLCLNDDTDHNAIKKINLERPFSSNDIFTGTENNKTKNFNSLKVNSEYEKDIEMKKNKKLLTLFSAIDKIKPFKEKEFLSNHIKSSAFKRENVFEEELDKWKMEKGIKDPELAKIKSAYKKNIGNLHKRLGPDTEQLNIVKKLDKILKKNLTVFHKKSKSVDRLNVKFGEIKKKRILADDYNFYRQIRKDSLSYKDKTGTFLYGNKEGHHEGNI